VVLGLQEARKNYRPQPAKLRGLALLSSMARGTSREGWWQSLFSELVCAYIPETSHSNFFSAPHSLEEIGRLISQEIALINGEANQPRTE
jgi:hypothetical protein